MKYDFNFKDMTAVAQKKLNSFDEASSRNGEYVLPFVSLMEPEIRVHEQYGHLLQEKNRLCNLRWIQKDLEKCLRLWKSFFNKNCIGSSLHKGRYTDKEGKFSQEILWQGFLDYSGKNKSYRMRLRMSNRKVLEGQLKINCKEKGVSSINKIKKKLESTVRAIEKTRKDIAETETRFNIALTLFQKEYKSNSVSGEEQRFDSAYRGQLSDICKRVKKELQNGRENPQEES